MDTRVLRAFNPLPSVQGQLFNHASQVSEDLHVVTQSNSSVSRLHRVDGMIRSFMMLNLFLIYYAIVHGCLVFLFIMSSLIWECPGVQQTLLYETNGRRIKILFF